MMIHRPGDRILVDKDGTRKTPGYHESGVQTAVRVRLCGGPGRLQHSSVLVYNDSVARAQSISSGLTTHSVNGASNSG